MKGASGLRLSEQFSLQLGVCDSRYAVLFTKLHCTLHARNRKQRSSDGMKKSARLIPENIQSSWDRSQDGRQIVVQFDARNDAGNIYAYPVADPAFWLLGMDEVKAVADFGEFSLSSPISV